MRKQNLSFCPILKRDFPASKDENHRTEFAKDSDYDLKYED